LKTKKELRQEFDAKYKVAEELLEIEMTLTHLSGLKHVIKSDRPFATFDVMDKADLKQLIEKLEPTTYSVDLKHGSTDYTIMSPYRFQLKSSIDQPVMARITFSTKLCDIWLDFNAELIKPFWSQSYRPVSDTEYHYFGGCSTSEILRMQIPCGLFQGKSLAYFGGEKTLIEVSVINDIINYIKTGEVPDENA
jgi:hypothetical protein